eukprot:6302541-Pyramimonas_sp.AAC.1
METERFCRDPASEKGFGPLGSGDVKAPTSELRDCWGGALLGVRGKAEREEEKEEEEENRG